MQCKKILPQNMTSRGTSGEGLKKFSRLTIVRHILRPSHKLWYYSTTTPDPLVGWEGCPLPIPHPSRRLRHLDPRRLRCLELSSPTFQTKVTPLAGPQACHSCSQSLLRELLRAVAILYLCVLMYRFSRGTAPRYLRHLCKPCSLLTVDYTPNQEATSLLHHVDSDLLTKRLPSQRQLLGTLYLLTSGL